jgi:TolB-like protein
MAPPSARRLRNRLGIGVGAATVIALAAAYGFAGHARDGRSASVTATAAPDTRSIGVVPFLDLTEGMQEATFADGMTEELIGKLSQVAGLKVPAPTASFYFKDKQVAPAEIGRALGVNYLLDGSVRKAGDRVRVAARLVRADDGFVLWSETYDRPFDDIITVQDDIATEARRALVASIERAALSTNRMP